MTTRDDQNHQDDHQDDHQRTWGGGRGQSIANERTHLNTSGNSIHIKALHQIFNGYQWIQISMYPWDRGPCKVSFPRKRKAPTLWVIILLELPEELQAAADDPHCRALTQIILSSSIFSLNSRPWLRLELNCWHIWCYLLQDHQLLMSPTAAVRPHENKGTGGKAAQPL